MALRVVDVSVDGLGLLISLLHRPGHGRPGPIVTRIAPEHVLSRLGPLDPGSVPGSPRPKMLSNVRKCKGRMIIDINTKTVLIFPDILGMFLFMLLISRLPNTCRHDYTDFSMAVFFSKR